MLEQLFGSNTRVDMLRLFFRNPEQSFFVREITRSLDTQINAVRRELQILVGANILVEAKPLEIPQEKPGSKLRKYYRVNVQSALYSELQNLILKEQVLEEQSLVNDIIEKAGTVKFLLITGRFTETEEAPSDMLIVGDLKLRNLSKLVEAYEKKYDVPVRYTTLTEEEFFERRHMMDKFLYTLFECKHIKVVDTFNI